jgi:serine/threonine protein kinase
MDKNDVDDFHFNTVIGRGTYAKVCLVTRKKDEKLFALKILKKKYIIEKNQEEHIMTEKQILA